MIDEKSLTEEQLIEYKGLIQTQNAAISQLQFMREQLPNYESNVKALKKQIPEVEKKIQILDEQIRNFPKKPEETENAGNSDA
ncbi:hypothetical protein [Methanolapillus millepedarum]|uniref:Uncharacterized protein n=1 Tax=Methanolapillus millepedarum TaxID=3028296 RepID=A0AA96ZUX5_9EURY|nr:hypothetical protein MsAc7_03260 [Methanosarcinaceae archaeon Ac7]